MTDKLVRGFKMKSVLTIFGILFMLLSIANALELKAQENKTGERIAMNDCTDCDTNKKMVGHPATQVEKPARGVASVVEVTNPNAHLGLEESAIKVICNRSKLLQEPRFNNVQNITSFEEILYFIAKKKKMLFELDEQNAKLPEESKAEVGQLWNDKLNQIYCPMGADFSLPGYIEIQLLMSGQTDALYSMYAGDDNSYALDVNRLLKDDPRSSDEDAKWITLADLVKKYIEHPSGQMNQRQALRTRFNTFYKFITQDWGGKHAGEFTAQEIEKALATRAAGIKK